MRLKELRKQKGITQDKLSRILGVSRTTISMWEIGSNEPDNETLIQLAKLFNVTVDYLVENEPQELPTDIFPLPKQKKIPLIGTIACGEPILAEQNIEDYFNCPDDIDADFCLRCKGDSMIGARIKDGDIVYIRQQPTVANGEIAAIIIENEATLKRVYKKKNSLILQPENPEYEPLIFERDEMNKIRILGKAICFLSRIK